MIGSIRLWVAFATVLSGSACSTIQSFFPDKEKDYQFTTEIPPLQIPADLKDNAIVDKPLIVEPISPRREETLGSIPESDVTGGESAVPFTPVELVDYDGGATRLRIEEPIAIAWRYVGKALSRHSIEINSRNEETFDYVVQYDPNAAKVEDGALWDEFVFFFGDDPAQEKEFHIKMAAKNARMTEVVILDRNDKPTTHASAMKLLRLLQNTINEDLAEDAKNKK